MSPETGPATAEEIWAIGRRALFVETDGSACPASIYVVGSTIAVEGGYTAW